MSHQGIEEETSAEGEKETGTPQVRETGKGRRKSLLTGAAQESEGGKAQPVSEPRKRELECQTRAGRE